MISPNKFIVKSESESDDNIAPDVDSFSINDSQVSDNKSFWWNSKVWVLYAKNTDEPFSKWELFLYNANTLDMDAARTLNMADRTVPYSECGYHEFATNDSATSTTKMYYPRQFAHLMKMGQPNMNKYITTPNRETADFTMYPDLDINSYSGEGSGGFIEGPSGGANDSNLLALDSDIYPYGFGMSPTSFYPNSAKIYRTLENINSGYTQDDENKACAWGIYDKTGRWICNGGKTVFNEYTGNEGGSQIESIGWFSGAPETNPYISSSLDEGPDSDGYLPLGNFSTPDTSIASGSLFWGHNIGWACDEPRQIKPLINSLHPLVHYSRSFLAGRIYKGSNDTGDAQNLPKHAVSFLGKTTGKFIKRPMTYERQNQGNLPGSDSSPLATFYPNNQDSHTDDNLDVGTSGINFSRAYGDGSNKKIYDIYDEDITLYELDEWTGHPGIVYKNYGDPTGDAGFIGDNEGGDAGPTPSQTDYGIWRDRPNFGGPEIEWPQYKPWVMDDDNGSNHQFGDEHYFYGRVNKAYGQMCSSVNRGFISDVEDTDKKWEDQGWTGYRPPSIFNPGKGYYVFVNRTWKSGNTSTLRRGLGNAGDGINRVTTLDTSGNPNWKDIGGWRFQSNSWPSDSTQDRDSNSNRWHNFSSLAVGDSMFPDYYDPGTTDSSGGQFSTQQRLAFNHLEYDYLTTTLDKVWLNNRFQGRRVIGTSSEDDVSSPSDLEKIKFNFNDSDLRNGSNLITQANIDNIFHTGREVMTGAVCSMHKLDLTDLGEINNIFPTVLKTKANPDDNVFNTNSYVPAYVCGVSSSNGNPGVAIITNNLVSFYSKNAKKYVNDGSDSVWGWQDVGVNNTFNYYGQYYSYRETTRNENHNNVSFHHSRDTYNLETTPITSGLAFGESGKHGQTTNQGEFRIRNAAIQYYPATSMNNNLTVFDSKPNIPLTEAVTQANGTVSTDDADSLNLYLSVTSEDNNLTYFAKKNNVFDLETTGQNIYIDNSDSDINAIDAETGGYFSDALISSKDDADIITKSGTGLAISLGNKSDNDAGPIKNGKYRYKITLEYDNQYESALNKGVPYSKIVDYETQEIEVPGGFDSDGNEIINQQTVDVTYESLDLVLTIKDTYLKSLNRRVTGVAIYRSGPDEEFSYGLVGTKIYKFNSTNFSFNSLNSSYELHVSDSGTTFQYHELNGISAEIEHTSLNYGMSTIYKGYMFVTHCYHPELKNVRHYIFRSLPNNFFTYDWSNEFCIMPEEPVAITSFNSRLYVWGKNKLYKVDPINLVIEDEYEGISIAGKDAFVKTEFGLCFLDMNNIYLHDGNRPNPIGQSIINVSSFPYKVKDGNTEKIQSGYRELVSQTIDNGDSPNIFYSGSENCFAICLSNSDLEGQIFTYNLPNKRWDITSAPRPKGVASSSDGSILIGDGNHLWDFASSPDREYMEYMRKEWTWHSKDFVLDANTQSKVFKGLNLVGTPSFYTIGEDSDVSNFTDTIGNTLSIRAYIDDKQVKLTRESKFYSTVNLGESYLGKDISSSDTAILVKTKVAQNNIQEFIRPGHYIEIDDELMFVNSYRQTAYQGDTCSELTVDRAQLKTTATSHTISTDINVASPRLKFESGSKGKRLKIVLEGQRGYVDSIGVIYKSKGVK